MFQIYGQDGEEPGTKKSSCLPLARDARNRLCGVRVHEEKGD